MKKMICRRLLSTMLVLVFAFTTFCFADLGQIAAASSQAQPVINTLSPTITFYAPEAIYLNPADADKTSDYSFRYFVDCTMSGALNRNAAQTSGTIYFSISQTCSAVTLSWASGTSATVSETGGGSTRTWTITGGKTNTRRGSVKVTVNYTLASTGQTYAVSRNVYMYMPRMNATVGVGGAYQYKTSIGTEPVTAATVLLTGLHRVGGGYRSMWTGKAGSTDNTSLLISMPSTQATEDDGAWSSGSAYASTCFYTNSGFSNDEGDGYDAVFNTVSTDGGGAKWCGRTRSGETTQTYNSGVVGQITVDKSRHTSMDTIPFLQGGWFIHYNAYSGASTGASFFSDDSARSLRIGSDAETFRAENAVSHPSCGTVPYHLTGTTPSVSTDYTMLGQFNYRRDSSSTVTMRIAFTLKVVVVDKAALRETLNQAISKGYRVDQLSADGWTTRVTTLNDFILTAGTALGNPEAAASEVTRALANLTNALENCVAMANTYAPETINANVVNMRGATFYVPETIYLKGSDRKTGEYIYGLTSGGAADDHGNSLTNAAIANGALVYWNKSGASRVTITAKLAANETTAGTLPTVYDVSDGIASMTVGGTARVTTACGTTGWTGTSGFSGNLTDITLSSAVSSGCCKYIEWTATYEFGGATYQQVAYTTVYAPMVYPVGAAARACNTNGNDNYLQSVLYVFGVHSHAAGNRDSINQLHDVFTAGRTYIYRPNSTGLYDNDGVDGYLISANGALNNINYVNSEGSNNHGEQTAIASQTAYLKVDTSRFSDLSAIPNLKAGWVCADDEDDGGDMNSLVSITYTTGTSASGTLKDLPAARNRHIDNESASYQLSPTHLSGTIADKSVFCHACVSDEADAVGDRACNRLTVTLSVSGNDKSALRTNVWRMVPDEMPINWYTTAEQNAYKLQLVKNFMALEDPAAANTTLPVPSPAPDNANRPGGVVTVRHLTTAAGNAEIDVGEAIEYKYGDDLYAHWNQIPGYTYASHTGTWSSLGAVQTVTYNGSMWLRVKNACQWSSSTTPLQTPGNKTVVFCYTPETYDVTYDLGATAGVTWSASAKAGQQSAITFADDATFDEPYALKDAPERIGYTFEAWRCSLDNTLYQGGHQFDTWKFDDDAVFTAEWTANVYNIAYQLNKPADAPADIIVINPNTRTEYTVADSFTIEAASLRGYTFSGWTASGDGANHGWGTAAFVSAAIPAGTYGDVTLTANWEKIEHTHNYTSSVTTEPTCTEPGVRTYSCECGASYTEAISALGHDFGDWIVTREATKEAEGEETRTCSRCPAQETRPIPKLPDDNAPVFALSGGTARTGETIDVTVSLGNNPGFVSTVLRLTYDPQVLTLTDVKNGDVFADAYFQPGGDLTQIPFGASWVSALGADNTQNGTLITYTFTVLPDAPAGSTTVTVTYDTSSTFDAQLQPVAFTVENAAWEIVERMPGDADGDGELSLRDVVTLRRAIVGGWGVKAVDVNADVNGDCVVDLRDVVLIHRFIVGGWGVVLQ